MCTVMNVSREMYRERLVKKFILMLFKKVTCGGDGRCDVNSDLNVNECLRPLL